MVKHFEVRPLVGIVPFLEKNMGASDVFEGAIPQTSHKITYFTAFSIFFADCYSRDKLCIEINFFFIKKICGDLSSFFSV